jgi:acyl carrier protein
MEKILLNWLNDYVGIKVTLNTSFSELNFDIFDEAVMVDFVTKQFGLNINVTEEWYVTVKDLLDEITKRTKTHV